MKGTNPNNYHAIQALAVYRTLILVWRFTMDGFELTPKLFQLSSPYMLKSNISLSPGEIANKASNILPQYRVQSVAFVKQTDLSNLSVEIKMRRIIWYHVTNTFIPTTR